ncbi:hypothetical protein [uncultured Ruminococcus sp.]|uniref:hypothetical protein n=1 Tax=uncultured Ruminococcus sp. TaxID=165186 RepID=UPI002632EDC3|nr:hypothetical protein [uncultured Ruminococcus sp.]
MTDKEKLRLSEAFGIPEPDKKKEFIEEFRKRDTEKQKKPVMPIIMRITAAAAMLAVCIGVITHMPKGKTNFGVSDPLPIVTETTSEAADTTADTNSEPTTAGISTSWAVTTEKDGAAVTTTAKDGKAVTTATAKPGTTSRESRPRSTTAASQRPTSARTTSAKVTTTKTGAVTTTSKNDRVIVTTSPPEMEEHPVSPIEGNSPKDLTVSPDFTYDVNGDIIDAGEFAVAGNSPTEPIEGNEGPDKQTAKNIQQMFDNSYAVVLAKIDKIVYTSIDGVPMTAENLTVQEAFRGDLKSGDRLTVFMDGGYMPADEYISSHGLYTHRNVEGCFVYDSCGCKGSQEEGDTLLFFIKDGGSELPDGAFSPVTSGDTAVFRNRYGRYFSLGDNSTSLSENDLRSLG